MGIYAHGQITPNQYHAHGHNMPMPDKDQHSNGIAAPSAHSAHSAGIVTSFHVSNMPDRWIVDTGATNHMASDLRLLYETCKQQSQHVYFPNGSKTSISHIGHCRLPQGVIQNVLHVPDFQYNLLSVPKLTREL